MYIYFLFSGYTDGGVEGGTWLGEWLRSYIFTLPLSLLVMQVISMTWDLQYLHTII